MLGLGLCGRNGQKRGCHQEWLGGWVSGAPSGIKIKLQGAEGDMDTLLTLAWDIPP